MSSTSGVFKFSKPRFIISVILFGILIFIALFVRDQFIRPMLGDVLVVIWLYFFVATFINKSPRRIAISVTAFAFVIEGCQYSKMLTILGLEHIKWVSIVLGATYDPLDLLAYSIGGAVCIFGEDLYHGKYGDINS